VFEETVALRGGEQPFALFGIDGGLILASVTIATLGIVLAWRLFGVELLGLRRLGDPERVRAIAARVPFLYRASLNKWWFDELNDLLFIRIGGRVAAAMWWFDRTVVDGTVNGIGVVVRDSGGMLRRIQTGLVQNYALGIAIGLIVMAGSFLVIVGQPR
jgi:NADH-quinone oxidoreductase subunit L